MLGGWGTSHVYFLTAGSSYHYVEDDYYSYKHGHTDYSADDNYSQGRIYKHRKHQLDVRQAIKLSGLPKGLLSSA